MSDQVLRQYEDAIVAAGRAGDLKSVSELNRAMQAALKAQNPNVDAPPDLAAEGAKMAAKGTEAGEAALIGTGRGIEKVIAGAKQAYNALPEYPLVEGSAARRGAALAAEQAEKDKAYAALQRERPFATVAGEVAPYAAIPASVGALPAALTVGAVEASKYGTPGERTGRGLMGAGTTFIGGTLANAAAKAVAPVTKKAAGAVHQGALEALERVGGAPTLGEATGSTFLRRLEDLVSRLPGGGSVMAEHGANRATAINRAAARSIGQEADEMTPAVFAAAHRDLGKVFDDIKTLQGRPIQIGPQVAAAADEVLATQAKMLPHQQDQNLIAIARQAKALSQNRGAIDGATYQLQRSGLSDAAFDATVGTNKQLYGKLLNALDDSADASLRAAGNDALADSLKVARPRWANLKTLEKGLTVEGGNAIPSRVASTMRTNNPGAFRQGRFIGEDLGDIATIGENLPPLRAGSQTFERETLSNPITAGLHYMWSKPVANILTSPVVTAYPRTIGKTAAARGTAELLEPSGRAAIAAALQQSGLLPPVAAEQR